MRTLLFCVFVNTCGCLSHDHLYSFLSSNCDVRSPLSIDPSSVLVQRSIKYRITSTWFWQWTALPLYSTSDIPVNLGHAECNLGEEVKEESEENRDVCTLSLVIKEFTPSSSKQQFHLQKFIRKDEDQISSKP